MADKEILLDVGCGSHKQEGFVGMDNRALPGVDVVHDVEDLPWPFEEGSVDGIVMSHLMEHIKPWLTIDVMNEAHRILKEGGQLFVMMPYGTSFGYTQDPTHCNPWNEVTPTYFDPEMNSLYSVYTPKPWKIESCYVDPKENLEIVFKKRPSTEAKVNKEKKAAAQDANDVIVRAARYPFLKKRVEELEELNTSTELALETTNRMLSETAEERDHLKNELERLNGMRSVKVLRAVKRAFSSGK